MTDPVHIRCHAELNDLLPAALRGKGFEFPLKKTRSIKDLIESLGIPHTEFDVILVNNHPVDFSCQIQGGENIEVYPAHGRATPQTFANQPDVPPVPRFVLDVHLGKLACYLRLLGFDTLYRNDYDDPELASISDSEQRILVTCDRKLLMRKRVRHGYLMRSRKAFAQTQELLSRYQLYARQTGEVRCLECNGIITAVEKKDIEPRLLPLTKIHYDEFFQCGGCSKIYWKGSHYTKMQTLVKEIRSGKLQAS